MMSTKQKISRLRGFPNQKWALHEIPVCEKLVIKRTEATSESEELTRFLAVLERGGKGDKKRKTFEPTGYGPIDLKDSNNAWNISYEVYGSKQEFSTNSLSSKKRVKRSPRYFTFGSDGVPIATQMALVDAVKGEAKGLSSSVSTRRSNALIRWYNGDDSKEVS